MRPSLTVGDVNLTTEGARAEVVAPPKAGSAGKTTSVWTRREGEMVQRETIWEAWREVRVVRQSAA